MRMRFVGLYLLTPMGTKFVEVVSLSALIVLLELAN
jgi:hypothetical protein